MSVRTNGYTHRQTQIGFTIENIVKIRCNLRLVDKIDEIDHNEEDIEWTL